MERANKTAGGELEAPRDPVSAESGVELHRVYVLNTGLFILRVRETISEWVMHGVTLAQE